MQDSKSPLAPNPVSTKVNGAGIGGGAVGVLIAYAWGEIMGKPLPNEVMAALTGIIGWLIGYAVRERNR